MLCYACREESSMAVFWEDLPSSWLKQIHWTELWNSYGRVGGRVCTPLEDQQSTNLDPWGLSEIKPPIKGHMDLVPHHIYSRCVDWSSWGPTLTGVGCIHDCIAGLWIHFLLTGLLCLVSVGEDVLSPEEMRSQGEFDTQNRPPLLREAGRRGLILGCKVNKEINWWKNTN